MTSFTHILNKVSNTLPITRYTIILFLLCITLTFAPAAAFSGGDGSTSDPYQISNVTELKDMQNDLSANYTLVENINVSVTETQNSDEGFEPIGNSSSSNFNGTFDGNNKTITGLYINRSDETNIGLFGYTDSGAEIKNVGLIDVNVTGGSNVGAIVGYNWGGTIDNSYSTGKVTGDGDYVGGLVGFKENGKINNSYSTGDVTGTNNVGGLVGHNTDSSANVTLSYAAGSVSGDTNVGGLIGLNGSEATVENSYWDIEATGQSSSAGIGEENGLTTAEMQGDAASSNMEGFDFTNTWFVIETSTEISYPLLQENTQKSASFSKPKTETETKSGSSTRTSIGPSQPPETVENTDSTIKKVLAGSNVKYDFSDSEGPVMGIGFDAKDNEGNVVAKVQVLKDKPDDVDPPSGNSYKLMSISVGSEGTINTGNADNILIEFKVSKEWVEENNIDPSTIRMTRFNNEEWQDLPSNQVDEDDEYLYFNAETPGFSIFRIVGDEMKEEAVEEGPATEQQSPSEEVEEPDSEEEIAQTPGFTSLLAIALIAGAAFVMRKD